MDLWVLSFLMLSFSTEQSIYDKSSSNLVELILNWEKNISWSHSAKSFTSKWYYPICFLSMKTCLTQNLLPSFSSLLILHLNNIIKIIFFLLLSATSVYDKLGAIRLIGNYSRDLGEIKLTSVRPIRATLRLKWKLALKQKPISKIYQERSKNFAKIVGEFLCWSQNFVKL